MRRLWRQTLAFGFRLLYNEMAWLYDPVSWIVSLGLWRRWQRTALAYLPPSGIVLEIAFGPGHLLVDLGDLGYQPLGLDLSRAMLRQAQRRLRRRGLVAPLCRGRAQDLPYAAGAFDALILTFPAPFVYDPAWVQEASRVLKPGGRLIVVEEAQFSRRDPATCLLEPLFRITGQRGPSPDLPTLLHSRSLRAWHERATVEQSTVRLTLAEKAALAHTNGQHDSNNSSIHPY